MEAVDRVRDEASLLVASDGHGQAARFIAHVKPLLSGRPDPCWPSRLSASSPVISGSI